MELAQQLSGAALGEEFHRAFDAALSQARKRLGHTHRLWVRGKALKSSLGTFQTQLPADPDLLAGRFQKATRDQVRQAITAAHEAGSFWREFGWQQRVAYLRKAAELIQEHQYDLAGLISLEIGKTRRDAYAEVIEGVQTMLYYCQQAERHQGFTYRLNGAGSELNQCALRPHGVWTVVTPFNFPFSIPAGTLVAALIGGNTTVFKPSSRGALVGTRMVGLLHDAGLPVGVCNLVTGPGPDLLPELAENPAVAGFAFTGSTAAGMAIVRRFAGGYPRPILAAMSGNNPVIVMPSANLEHAAEGIVRSAFLLNGQHCAACHRLYVHRKIARPLGELLAAKTAALPVGDPLARETALGPLIDSPAVAQYKKAITLGKRQGRLRTGGQVLRRGDLQHGRYVEPAFFDRLPANASWLRQSWLVPVLGMAEVASLREAIDLANATYSGLAAGLFSTVEEEQVEFFNRIEAASTYCNRRDGATTGGWAGVQSVGGWKASSSSCRNPLGPFYVAQFLREQSQTLVHDTQPAS